MSKGRRVKSLACRIGHHRWNCRDSRRCTGGHRCLDCGA